MTEIVLGVTGTRQKPTTKQLHFLYDQMLLMNEQGCRTLHHGCCIGWDEAAHWLARSLGWKIVVHPPTNSLYLAQDPLDDPGWDVEIRAEKPYRERNEDIVFESTHIIGGPQFPKDDERSKRSGSWMTLRMAYDACKPWRAVFPDGSTTYGEW